MIDDFLVALGEAFLDILIDRTFKRNSIKKQLFYSGIFALVLIFYLSLFILTTYLAFTTRSIKMIVTSILLLLILVVYGKTIIGKWKSNRINK